MKEKAKKVYIVGIEGAGTSALAQIYQSFGWQVSGSDEGDHFYREVLRNKGIETFDKFAIENIPKDIDFAVRSSSVSITNLEVAEIRSRKVKFLTYAQALGELFKEKFSIAVCGSHGKTTTTAMLAEVFGQNEADPLALVGSRVIDWQTNVLLGQGKYFIAEADEYQNKLTYYNPQAAILTSVDWDHPDFFPDEKSYKKVFADFVAKIPQSGFLAIWGDSANTLQIAQAAHCRVLKYGFSEDNDYEIRDVQLENQNGPDFFQSFRLFYRGEDLGQFKIKLSGKHNVLNASAVIILANRMGFDLERIRKALAGFRGTARRFEILGKKKGALVIDDYAHHPDEIQATLAGARQRFADKKITVAFQPHTFTRTEKLLQEFAQSFDDADEVLILDIYASVREKSGKVSAKDLIKLINTYSPGKAFYFSNSDQEIADLIESLGREDVFITMGAGDIWNLGKKLVSNEGE